jgi:phage tail sheath protein FI
MPFQVSPGVNVTEIDLTTIVPAVASTEGCIAGIFRWGPIDTRELIDSEDKLLARFGLPYKTYNEETWFTAASFLSYGNKLYVTRVANTTSANTDIATHSAVANVGAVASIEDQAVLNDTHYGEMDGNFDTDVLYVAKYPGSFGNSLRISVCDTANAFASEINLASYSANVAFTYGSNTATIQTANSSTSGDVADLLSVNDLIKVGNSEINEQYLKITAISSDGANVDLTFEDRFRLREDWSSTTTLTRQWEFHNLVDVAPGQSEHQAAYGNTSAQDEMHIVIVDENGKFTNNPGAVLEVFVGLSRSEDNKTADGATKYYKTVINEQSNYVWWANDRSGAASATAENLASSSNEAPLNIQFQLGNDGLSETGSSLGLIARGYDRYASAEDIDISLILQGKAKGGADLVNYIIDNICEIRKDCVVFASPPRQYTVNNTNNELADVTTWKANIRSSSYVVVDSGYKYMYDKYNDIYRYVPLNGDIAGLCVRTDNTNDPWWSPAGFNRGNIKNIVKLAYNPRKADRDILYKAGINPVVTFPGQGTVLFGDKTGLNKPSAFDRINVRRLFIVLEKAIATAAKFTLFEFNDDFTRAQFKNLVIPYLRDVQARRGITDFLVVCDTTNNTPEVIDRNEFIGDIYIKPARSINFIQLNFVAVRTGVAFSEVVGKF